MIALVLLWGRIGNGLLISGMGASSLSLWYLMFDSARRARGHTGTVIMTVELLVTPPHVPYLLRKQFGACWLTIIIIIIIIINKAHASLSSILLFFYFIVLMLFFSSCSLSYVSRHRLPASHLTLLLLVECKLCWVNYFKTSISVKFMQCKTFNPTREKNQPVATF